jgi:hypothetical protein
MQRRSYPFIESSLIMGAPLLLALVELLHPQPHDLLKLDVRMWLAVHYAQIALFPLAALAIAWPDSRATGRCCGYLSASRWSSLRVGWAARSE